MATLPLFVVSPLSSRDSVFIDTSWGIHAKDDKRTGHRHPRLGSRLGAFWFLFFERGISWDLVPSG